ncbi:MAG: carboxypeptidase regulatory-like domain-containing protein [Ilumatobacter sp.]|uniref:carboxypeptidase regulatory-like domain-containing protein n=1 Tax=Ilumatobacter sp. TaxID=1967498 RepID=UPI0026359652|nr:carboxypeptidase regulatory-like domain-containing protein [Ilumatobacter sp.]MDJ0770718.1 carboxypeptidase regulatory-like domain-containing protein [Ilumatobacter sp.]
MGMIGRVLAVLVVALVPSATARARTDGFFLDVSAHPDRVVPTGSDVRVTVGLHAAGDPEFTITAVMSDRFGDVADAANPALVDTSCVVPSTRLPGDPVPPPYEWACSYIVNIAGGLGTVVDTVTVLLTLPDTTELTVFDDVSVSISDASGAIRGTIVDDVTGTPVAGVHMMAMGPTGAEMSTDAAGRFDLQGLEPGDYQLVAGNNVTMIPSEYAREWYDDAPDMASADAVTVVGGEATTLTWGLSLGGVIEGAVTDELTGAPLAGARAVWVAVMPDGDWEGSFVEAADADGAYRISGLHEVGVLVCFRAPGYVPECWNDVPWASGSGFNFGGDQIAAAPRTVISGIDAALTPDAPATTTTAPVTTTLPTTTTAPVTTTLPTTTIQPAPTTTFVPAPVNVLPATGGNGAHLTIVALGAVIVGLVAVAAARRPHRRACEGP